MREDVKRVQAAAAELLAAVKDLHPLLSYNPSWALTDDGEDLNRAVQLLDDDVPLAERFRDGGYANPPYTPGQVIALARQAGWSDPITHEQEEYHRILAEVREELGRRHRVPCTGMTASGRECRSFALAYGLDEDSRLPGCHSHSTKQEKEYNKKMQQREERVFHERLNQAGIDQ